MVDTLRMGNINEKPRGNNSNLSATTPIWHKRLKTDELFISSWQQSREI